MNLKNDNKYLHWRHWRVLGSEYLRQKPWLTVRKERLQLSNGNSAPEYYVLEYANWVNTIAITSREKIRAGEAIQAWNQTSLLRAVCRGM